MRHDFDRGAWIRALQLESGADQLQDLGWHEIVTQAFLARPDGELHLALERVEAGSADRIRAMLRGFYYLEYLPRVLSSDVDIDRADYLLRDAHESGVAYGRYDVDWLITTCGIGFLGNGDLVVGFEKRKSLRVVEQFMVARRALYETAYYHKTVLAAQVLLHLFVDRLRSIPFDELMATTNPLFGSLVGAFAGRPINASELARLDDDLFWVFMVYLRDQGQVDWTLRDLARRVVSRDLLKWVPLESEAVRDYVLEDGGLDRIRNAVRPFATGDPAYYCHVHTARYKHLSTDERTKGYFIDEERQAVAMSDEPVLNPTRRRPEDAEEKKLMLFAVREAVPALVRLVKGGGRRSVRLSPEV